MNPKATFSGYARGLYHFDGGNPYAPIWICGIEPGGVFSKEQFTKQSSEVDQYSRKDERTGRILTCWNDLCIREIGSNLEREEHHLRVAKILITAYGEGDPSNYEQVLHYAHTQLYRQDGRCFRLNLFPLNHHDVNAKWQDEKDTTGFDSYEEYKCWCRLELFPEIRKLLQEFHETWRVVLAMGISCWDDFVSVFDGREDDTVEDHPLTGGKKVCVLRQNQGDAKLVISPALTGGYPSAMSYNDMEPLAAIIGESL